MKKTTRAYELQEIRAADDDSGDKIIEGHAAVFDQLANIGDQFYEVIERGAFDGADVQDVFLYWNHEHNTIPLARTKSGTMKLWIDEVGLAIRAVLDVANNPAARELWSAVERGDCSGMSFCFSVADDDWRDLQTDMPTRVIHKIKRVYEVSATAMPAYEGTDLHGEAQRTLTDARKKQSDWAEVLRLRAEISKKAAEPKKAVAQSEQRQATKTQVVNKMKRGFDYERAGKTFQETREAVTCPMSLNELRTLTIYPPSGERVPDVVPSYSGATVNPDNSAFVSSLVDAVRYVKLNGGESFEQPFSTDIIRGYYTDEQEKAKSEDGTFTSATLYRSKIVAYTEISEELEKLPYANYAEFIFQTCGTAIRKLLSKEILFGTGDPNSKGRICGIFSERAAGLSEATDMSMSAIRDTTLDEILFRYDVVGSDLSTPPTLILSKKDLNAFASVRTSTRAKFYDVRFTTADTGTISGVPFILSADVKSLMSMNTEAGEYCMCFGNLKHYSLIEFSPLVIKRSDDFKFPQGMICFRGSLHVGGNVCARDSFIRVKKA